MPLQTLCFLLLPPTASLPPALTLQSCPPAAKALLLRLLLRKRTWFQLAALQYPEVERPEAAAARLAAVGLLQWDTNAAGPDLANLLAELPTPALKQVLAAVLPKGHPAVQQVAAAAAGAGGGSMNKAAVVKCIQVRAQLSVFCCVARQVHCPALGSMW